MHNDADGGNGGGKSMRIGGKPKPCVDKRGEIAKKSIISKGGVVQERL